MPREPGRPGGLAGKPLPAARITAGTHLLLALVLTGGLANFIWLVAG